MAPERQRLDQHRDDDRRRRRSRARAAWRSRACASATAVYIVMMAPKTAPMPISTAMPNPTPWMRPREHARLLRVVLGLAPHLHVELRVRREPVPERVEGVGGDSRRAQHRLEGVAAAVGALQHARVAPDLGFGDAAAGLEDADDLPACSRPSASVVADVEPGELPVAPRPDDRSRCVPGSNMPALDDLHLVADLERRRLARRAAARWPSVPVDRFGRSTITNSSAEASGRLAVAPDARRLLDRCRPRRRPGRWSSRCRRRCASRARASGEPGVAHRGRKPSAIDSTDTNTTTTPAMPTMATADEPSRCGIVRRLSAVTASVWRDPVEHVQPSSGPPSAPVAARR